MATLYPHQVDDLVNLTIKNFKRKKWVDISLTFQRYEFAGRVFSGKKVPERGGTKLNWKVQTGKAGNAKDSGLFAVDTKNVVNLTKEAEVDWTKQTTHWEYDVDEGLFQSEPEMIVDELAVREHDMFNGFFELMEERLWTAPASSTLDPMRPSGIPFWIQKSATEGFNGGNPSGWTSGCGGLSSVTYPTWRNWTDDYISVDQDDLIPKICKAMEFCKFTPPHDYPELAGGRHDWILYTVYSVWESVRKLQRAQNDNLGQDVGWYKGSPTVMGTPLIWVPALTDSTSAAYDSSNPVYGVNWKSFSYYFLKGRNMLRYPPKPAANQHTVREVHMDNWGNFRCLNRRDQFVLYVA